MFNELSVIEGRSRVLARVGFCYNPGHDPVAQIDLLRTRCLNATKKRQVEGKTERYPTR